MKATTKKACGNESGSQNALNGICRPRHVAIIMDGNGRWAEQRSLPRIKGHREGANSVVEVVKACREMGIEYLTLYAFSVENWVRPQDEVKGLMQLLNSFLQKEEKMLHENEIRLRVIGRIEDLPANLQGELRRVVQETRSYARGNLTVALSYGGRTEIAYATRQIAEKVATGEIEPDEIDEDTISAHLYAPDLPDPDLMIRTSGEQRISNFLLWELTYTELYFTDILWPDFREEAFRKAVETYGKRRRRFGNIG